MAKYEIEKTFSDVEVEVGGETFVCDVFVFCSANVYLDKNWGENRDGEKGIKRVFVEDLSFHSVVASLHAEDDVFLGDKAIDFSQVSDLDAEIIESQLRDAFKEMIA